jgi:uncharacterized protein (DUF2147 family)
MHSLVYNQDKKEWEGGHIYDPSSGREWSAIAWITEEGQLKVRGYWHFQFLGQNISFNKIP